MPLPQLIAPTIVDEAWVLPLHATRHNIPRMLRECGVLGRARDEDMRALRDMVQSCLEFFDQEELIDSDNRASMMSLLRRTAYVEGNS